MSGPLPQGWITENDPTGRPYYVDTQSQNPHAVWDDPREQKKNLYAPPPPSGNQYAPPGQQQQQQQQQYQPQQQQQNYQQQQGGQQQYPQQGQQQQQQPQQGGLMGSFNQFMHPSTPHPSDSNYNSNAPPPQKHGLSTGQMIAGGLGALAVAGVGYELYEHEENKHEGFGGGGGGRKEHHNQNHNRRD